MKRILKTSFTLLILSFAAFPQARASHATGTDISYKCLGNNQYEVIVRFYQECNSNIGAINPIATITNMGCGGNTTFNVALNLNQNLSCQNGGISGTIGCEISQVCPAYLPLTACNAQPGTYPGLRLYEYTGTFTLPSACSQWAIKFTQNSRNTTNNIIGNQDFSVQAIINNTIDPSSGNPYCNTSPSFFNAPIVFTCINSITNYFHGATEPDGDSLIYKLTPPLGTNYTPITNYASGYSFDQPIKTNPPLGLFFNQSSGEMMFSASQNETDVIAVQVEEYRNGILVGTSMRDVQLKIINCVKSNPEFALAPTSYQNAIQLDSVSYQVCPGANFQIQILGFERNNQTISLSSTIQSGANSPLQGANFSTQFVGIGTQDSALATIQWNPTLTDVGCRYFSIKATTNSCPVAGEAIKSYRICVGNKVEVNPDTAYYCGSPIQVFSNGGTGGIWSPSVGVSNVNTNSPFITPTANNMWYYFNSSCGQDSVFIITQPSLNINVGQDGSICLGDSFQLHVFYDSTLHPNAQVKWTPSVGLFDPISGLASYQINHPIAKPQFSTAYTVEVSTGYGCLAQSVVNVSVRSTKNIAQITSTKDTICPGIPIELTASNYSTYLCGLASDTCGGSTKRAEIGSSSNIQGGGGTIYPSIYGSNKKYVRHQLLIKASELQAKLGNTGCQIYSLETFLGSNLNSSNVLNNFTIKLSCVRLDSLVKFENSLLQVFDPKNVTPVPGRNLHIFDHSYNWDGQSDLVVDFCFENINSGSINNKDVYSITPFRSYYFEASNISSSCNVVYTQTQTVPVYYTYRPNVAFNTCLANAPTSTFTWTPTLGANAPTTILAGKAFAQPLTPQVYTINSIDSFGCVSSASKEIYVDTSFSSSCIGRRIFGNVHQFIASNCAGDSANPGQALSNVKVNLIENGIVIAQTFSSNSGDFSFQGSPLSTYVIKVDSTNLPFSVSCPSNGQRPVSLTLSRPKAFNQDFALACDSSTDMQVHLINGRYRIGSPTITHIQLGDISSTFYKSSCSSSSSGKVVTILNGPVTYIAPASGALIPSSINGDTLFYNIADFSTLSTDAFDLELQGNLSQPLGSQVCIKTIVSAMSDTNHLNDTLEYCSPTINSFDPNEKEVYPTTMSSEGGWLTYTIHFQNTGNDTAYNVIIRDTLPTLVDEKSFIFLGSSHFPEIQIINGITVITYKNIYLVDSATNERLSKGWIQFKIKANPNLPAIFSIANRAAIFFDQNAPIITDYAITRNKTLGIENVGSNLVYQVFPNPTTSNITIQAATEESVKLNLTDLTGRKIKESEFRKSTSIDVSNLQSGIYLLNFESEFGAKAVYKIVKE